MTEEEFEIKWERYKANGRKRKIEQVIYGDCFEQLGENEQDQIIEDVLDKNTKLRQNVLHVGSERRRYRNF